MKRNRRAGVEDRWTKTIRDEQGNAQKVPSAASRQGHALAGPLGRRPTAESTQRRFARKVDAQQWLDEVTAAVVTGQYVDPKAGQVTFRDYAERWREMQVQRPSSRAHVETMLRRHAYPTLGDRRLSSIMPSDIQAWVKGLELAPATVGVIHGIVSTVMKAAIRDRRIASNPCDGTKLPKVQRKQIVPLTTEQVAAVRDALPPQLQALVTLAAGTGMRQGECFGLTVDRVRFLERTVTVDRQLVTVAEAGALPRTAQDEGEQPDHSPAPGRCGRAGGTSGGVSCRALTAWCSLCRGSRSPGRCSGTSGVQRCRRRGFRPGPASTRFATTTRAC